MIEISIFGANYGETIIVTFETSKGRTCGVIDCYYREGQNKQEILQLIREKCRTEALAFVIATHPHDDHIKGLPAILDLFQGNVEVFGWWGGASLYYTLVYFQRLEQQYRESDQDLDIRSKDVYELLEVLKKHRVRVKKIKQSTDGEPKRFYKATTKDGNALLISPVSPWLPQQSSYLSKLVSAVDFAGHINTHKCAINQTSLALTIEYGSARMLFGGDAEFGNWDQAFKRDILNSPIHLLKVPHHGSRTGLHPEFEKLVTSTPQPSAAIVTQFHKAGTRLPDAGVLKVLQGLGYDVWVVGGSRRQLKKASERISSDGFPSRLMSRIDICVHPDARIKIKPGDFDLHFPPHRQT